MDGTRAAALPLANEIYDPPLLHVVPDALPASAPAPRNILVAAVALNEPQYGDSLMCGACVEGTANGEGAGGDPIPSTFKGFITDK